MRLQLIYLSVVALATFAAPLVGLHDRLDGEHTSLAQPHDSRDSEPASLAVRNEARSLSRSLLPLLDEFDMQKTFLLEDPPSKGTRVVPSNAMTAVPTDIEFVTGKFNPDAIIKAAQDRLMVDPPTYDTIATVLAATAHTADLVKSPISGEAGLTHVLYQQLGGPLNAILAAVAQGDWSVRGKGDAPIEDWRFIVNQDKRAVLELKTSHALTGSAVKTIMRLVRAKGFKMAKVRDDNKAIVNSLVDKTAPAKKEPTRTKRGKHVLALEQVVAEMYNAGSFIGVLTNGHDWVVCQRITETNRATTATSSTGPSRDTRPTKETIAVTRLTGVKPDGKSNALSILLAMSLYTEPPKPSNGV